MRGLILDGGLRGAGVTAGARQAVVGLLEGKGWEVDSITLADGSVLPADVVVLAVGVKPEDGLARAAGLDVHERGGILVGSTLQTNDPDIYAVGDAALVKDPLGRDAFVALAWGANRQGRLAADHIMGLPVHFGAHPATAIAKVFSLAVASTGLSDASTASTPW
jgi:NADPH-dependent 2,4-dienoyl-CoA reductase/sulfur reductase-like enzyme